MEGKTTKTKTKPAANETIDDDGDYTGLICPRCGCRHFLPDGSGGHESTWKTVRTELRSGAVRRRRICRHCGRRIFTIERAEDETSADHD